MTEYNICGVMVHARPDCRNQVEQALVRRPGVEVHANTEEGRLVVTVEDEDRRVVADTISSFHDIDGVLSAAMIYQFSDDSNSTKGAQA
jgi:nitrate reductase NapD